MPTTRELHIRNTIWRVGHAVGLVEAPGDVLVRDSKGVVGFNFAKFTTKLVSEVEGQKVERTYFVPGFYDVFVAGIVRVTDDDSDMNTILCLPPRFCPFGRGPALGWTKTKEEVTVKDGDVEKKVLQEGVRFGEDSIFLAPPWSQFAVADGKQVIEGGFPKMARDFEGSLTAKEQGLLIEIDRLNPVIEVHVLPYTEIVEMLIDADADEEGDKK